MYVCLTIIQNGKDEIHSTEFKEMVPVSREVVKHILLNFMLAIIMGTRMNLNTDQVNSLLVALSHLEGQEKKLAKESIRFYSGKEVYPVIQGVEQIIGLWLKDEKILLLEGDDFRLSYYEEDEDNSLATHFRIGEDDELFVFTETNQKLIDFHNRQVVFSKGKSENILEKMDNYGEEKDEFDSEDDEYSQEGVKVFINEIGPIYAQKFKDLVESKVISINE